MAVRYPGAANAVIFCEKALGPGHWVLLRAEGPDRALGAIRYCFEGAGREGMPFAAVCVAETHSADFAAYLRAKLGLV